MKPKVKILHLSHVGPSKIPSGGRVLIASNLQYERELELDSHWLSIRPNKVDGERKSKNHKRDLEGSHNGDLPSLYWDHKMSYAIANSKLAQDFLKSWIDEKSFTIFVLEGPWLWPILRLVLNHYPALEYNIVYAAHNVEYDLAFKIAEATGCDNKLNARSQALLLQDESDLVARSIGVTFLSEHDGSLLKSLGAKKLIRTYVPSPASKPRRFNFGTRSEPLLDPQFKWFTFVSGDWAPHLSGITALVEAMEQGNQNKIGIAIVGNISAGIQRVNSEIFKKFSNEQANVRVFGPVTDRILERVITESAGFVLPVDFGGGMGIKTIEALQTYKPVFGTRAAFRGLEGLDLGRQVTISQNSAELWGHLQSWNNSDFQINKEALVFDNKKLIKPSVDFLLSLSNKN
jgi:hypothetical protein